MAWSYRIVDHVHYVALHVVEESASGELLHCSSKPIDFAFDASDGVAKLIAELEMALKTVSAAPMMPLP